MAAVSLPSRVLGRKENVKKFGAFFVRYAFLGIFAGYIAP